LPDITRTEWEDEPTKKSRIHFYLLIDCASLIHSAQRDRKRTRGEQIKSAAGLVHGLADQNGTYAKVADHQPQRIVRGGQLWQRALSRDRMSQMACQRWR
jgi:hypothetical protein